MLFALIALWFIAVMLLLMDPKSITMRYMSAVAFTGGTGALAAVIDGMLIPYLEDQGTALAAIPYLYDIQAAGSLLSYYGLPYSFVMLALHYHPDLSRLKLRPYLTYVLLLPPAACLLFTPGYNEYEPITFPLVAVWAVPYIFVGAVIIFIRKERLPALQRTHRFTCLALLPPVLCFAVLNYILPSMGYYRMWVYHAWILAVVVPFFFFILFKFGFLGFRLLIERRKMDSTLRAITSGTAILHHAIKNDVGKMRLFLDKLKQYAEETRQPELLQDLDVVLNASQHIREMISRVHEQTQELPVRLSPVLLLELFTDVLKALQPSLGPIPVRYEIPGHLALRLDRTQVSETLTNVLMNAIEAMPHGGEITVKAFITKKNVVLEIHDTGTGMDKAALKQALEPFYTTKSGSRSNFGLGLAYCYSVMNKHGGSLELKSSPGQGTSVFLTFPGTSLLPHPFITEERHGTYQTSNRRG